MEKVKVFHFRVYDPTKDEIIVPAFKSTRKRIEGDLIKGEIIPHTGQMVFVSDLDAQDRYDPNKGTRGAAFDFGDDVETTADAPPIARPGSIASVCGMTADHVPRATMSTVPPKKINDTHEDF